MLKLVSNFSPSQKPASYLTCRNHILLYVLFIRFPFNPASYLTLYRRCSNLLVSTRSTTWEAIKLSTATASTSNDIVDKFYCLFFISIRLIYKFVDMWTCIFTLDWRRTWFLPVCRAAPGGNHWGTVYICQK